jgi:hypothetical protein
MAALTAALMNASITALMDALMAVLIAVLMTAYILNTPIEHHTLYSPHSTLAMGTINGSYETTC